MFDNIRKHIDIQSDLNQFRIHNKNLYEDKDGFTWEDKNEFRKDDKLFDVVEIIKDADDDYLIVYAINDKEEENLLKSFSSILDDLINEHTSNPKIRTIIFNLISQALPKSDFEIIIVNQSFIMPDHFMLVPNSVNIDPPFPPPKFV
jgi:hypothetical protein